jgi:hypothetical protein
MVCNLIHILYMQNAIVVCLGLQIWSVLTFRVSTHLRPRIHFRSEDAHKADSVPPYGRVIIRKDFSLMWAPNQTASVV